MSNLFKKTAASGKVGVPGFRPRANGRSEPLTGIEPPGPGVDRTMAGTEPPGGGRRRRRRGPLGGARSGLAPRTVLTGTY